MQAFVGKATWQLNIYWWGRLPQLPPRPLINSVTPLLQMHWLPCKSLIVLPVYTCLQRVLDSTLNAKAMITGIISGLWPDIILRLAVSGNYRWTVLSNYQLQPPPSIFNQHTNIISLLLECVIPAAVAPPLPKSVNSRYGVCSCFGINSCYDICYYNWNSFTRFRFLFRQTYQR